MIDITGQKFNKLTALEIYGTTKDGSLRWLCKCDCGNTYIVSSYRLRKGLSKDCGCVNKLKKIKHGMFGTRFYKIWKGMKYRATKKRECNKHYTNINICDEWLNFINFKNDMYDNYLKHINEFGEKQTTIDRIDNNGDYCKQNCRWATLIEQSQNRKNKSNCRAKITKEDVLYIRNSNIDKHLLTIKYKINERTIRDIRAGRTWKEI